MRTGPLGSTIHVLHADSQTVVELASIDWNRSFRRVCLDPVRGLITLVVPSRLHEEFSAILGHVVDIAASALADAAKDLRNARLREPGSPPGTGMEPDCAFYLGQAATLFFQLISRRYERGPMILTSNQSFGSWGDVFGDRVIASAILDRIRLPQVQPSACRRRRSREPGWAIAEEPDVSAR